MHYRLPFGRAGTVSYGPNLNAAAIVLGSEGNVPVERTAMLIHTLLGVEASAGFVARAAERLAEKRHRPRRRHSCTGQDREAHNRS
jgi:hypothetical protein